MLKKSLEMLLVGVPLILIQPSFANAQYTGHPQQKSPIIYEHVHQENLNDKLQKQIATYIKIISNGGYLNEDNIEQIFSYKRWSFSEVPTALFFYDYVIENYKSSRFLAKSYLESGKMLCFWASPRNVEEGIIRLNKAVEIGNQEGNEEIQAEALYTHGNVEMIVNKNEENAKVIFKKVVYLYPNTESAKNSKLILQGLYGEK